MTRHEQTPPKSGIEKKLEKEMLKEARKEQADKHQPASADPPEITRDPSAVSRRRGHENASVEPEDEQAAQAAAVKAGRESAESDLRREGQKIRE